MNIRTTTTLTRNIPPAQLIDEAERLATFQQSAMTRAGETAQYQPPRKETMP